MVGLTCRVGAHNSRYAHDTRLYPMHEAPIASLTLRECRDVNRYIVFYSQVRTTMEISLKTFSVILGVVYILYMYVWNI